MNIVEISEKEFNYIDHARQVIYHENSRKFAFFELEKNHGKYGLSWCSDLVKPVIIDSSNTSLIWIGIDQKLVSISKLRGNIIVSLKLNSSLIDIACSEAITAVLTEAEVFVFNHDGSIQLIKDLPEIGSGLSISNNTFCIDMIDGETLDIEIDALNLVSV
jgi:hypothetical protein